MFRTTDLDEAREKVASVYCPHRIELLPGHVLDALQNVASLDAVRLSFLTYGGAVRITPGCLESFYLVQIPLAGRGEISAGRRSLVSTPSLATVLSPDDPVDMVWSEEARWLDVYVDRRALERRLEAAVRRPLRAPLRFSLALGLGTETGRCWLRLVGLLREELESNGVLLRHSLALAQLEELLISALLFGQPSNYSGLLHGETASLSPRGLRRVLDYIHEHLAEPLSVTELARVGEVSVRSLQQSFRRHLGVTPTAYIRDLRLERVHADLVAADPDAGDSVAEIASRWGFTHLGRFASLYRAAFGRPPSCTLRD